MAALLYPLQRCCEGIITTGEWSCLISFARASLSCKKRKTSEKFKMNIYNMPPLGIEPATLGFPTGRFRPLGHRDRCFAAFKNSYNNVNAESDRECQGILKLWKNQHSVIQWIKLIMARCILEQTVGQNLHAFHKCKCYFIAVYKTLHEYAKP